VDHKYFNRIAATYGLGVDEFLDLFAAQNHSCAVCKTALVLFSSAKGEKPVVDHCHVTGKVRGILCNGCNVSLGWLEKNPERTARLARYICATQPARVAGPMAVAAKHRHVTANQHRRDVDQAQAEYDARMQDHLDPTRVLISELQQALNTSQEGNRQPLGESGALEKRPDVELKLVTDEEVKIAK